MKTIVSGKLKSFGSCAAKKILLAAGFVWMLLIVICNAYPQFAESPALIRTAPASSNPGGNAFLVTMLGSGSTNNMFPYISSLLPSSAVAGGPGFILTAYGSNFTTDSTILWIGSILPTTYVSPNQLQADIPASYIETAGKAVVSVLKGDVRSYSSCLFTIADPSAATPPPSIGAISPRNANPGGPGFVLTAYGSNLTSDSIVLWNGSIRETTYVNPNQLRAYISAIDIAAPGAANVSVYTPAGTTNTLQFNINYLVDPLF
jgi:hypothetical protein